jgi:hypothetical protein
MPLALQKYKVAYRHRGQMGLRCVASPPPKPGFSKYSVSPDTQNQSLEATPRAQSGRFVLLGASQYIDSRAANASKNR